MTPRQPSPAGDRGSVLFLYPLGLLIVVLLGAIAVDLGNLWLQQRRLADAADSAANDAVAFAFDLDRFRSAGSVTLDENRVADAVAASVAGQALTPRARVVGVDTGFGPSGNPTVVVTLESDVRPVFGVVAGRGPTTIRAVGAAELVRGPPAP